MGQDKIVLTNGETKYGQVWDIEQDKLMFMEQHGILASYSPKDLLEVHLDEVESKAIIKKIKRGSVTGYQKGQKAAQGRLGMALLNLGAGVFSGTTGVIHINGIQTEEMILQEVQDYSGPDRTEFQAGYLQTAQKQNRRSFRLGFITGVISNLICNPHPGFGTRRIGF